MFEAAVLNADESVVKGVLEASERRIIHGVVHPRDAG